MNNKKGQLLLSAGVLITILIVAGILLIGLGVAIFSNLPLMIGIAMIILTLIFGFKGDMNRTKGIFMTIFIVIGTILVFSSGIAQSIIGEQIWTVDSGRLECLEDSVEVSSSIWVDQERSFTCGSDYLVDDCRIVAACGSTSLISPNCNGAYKINNGAWITYSVGENQKKQLTTIFPGQKIEFTTKVFTNKEGIGFPRNEDQTEIRYIRNPYRLFTIEAGAKIPSNSANCRLADQSKIRRENIEYGEWDTLEKGEIRNYFFGWVLKSGLKVYDYNNKEAICGFNSLYELEKERLADGSNRVIQGKRIKSVECCPHQDDNCGDNFEFIPEEKVDEQEVDGCIFNYQCANLGNIKGVNDELATQESCIDRVCVKEEINIECNSDAKCISLYGNGYFCDKRQINFGQCIQGGGGLAICGDNICQTGETFENCQADCDEDDIKLDCAWYQEEKTINEVDRTWYNYIGIGSPEVITSQQCKTADWTYLVMGSVLVLILGLTFILTSPKRKKK